MKFRTIPPDPSELPRAKLIWPAVVPVLVLLYVALAELSGHTLNIHGGGALLIAIFFVSLLAGTVASLLTLSSVIPALRKYPTLRSRANLAYTAFGVIFAAVALTYLLFGVVQMARG